MPSSAQISLAGGAVLVALVFEAAPLESGSSCRYDQVMDVMEELVKFTLLTRDHAAYLTSRYSERKADAAAAQNVDKLVNAATQTR